MDEKRLFVIRFIDDMQHLEETPTMGETSLYADNWLIVTTLNKECPNSECHFEHEGYCCLEEIDLEDEEIDLNVSFDCPEINEV